MSRILFATIGSLGDVHPLMAIGRDLLQLGHEVTVATSDRHGDRIQEAGLRFREIPPKFPDEKDYNRLMKRWMDPGHGSNRVIQELVIPSLRATHAKLEPLVHDADLVIIHPFVLTGAFWAEKYQKPWCAIPFAPIMFTSRFEPPVMGNFQNPQKLQWFGTEYPLRWLFQLAKRANTRIWKLFGQIREEMGQKPIQGHPLFDFYIHQANLVIAPFSRVLGAPQADWPHQAVQTGFAFYDGDEVEMGATADQGLSEFLSRGRPPLVFSLGSTGVYTAGDFYLEAWKAAVATQQRALMLVGPDESVKLPENTGPDCHIVRYAPHVQVFPRASVVVHHGGVNSTGQALRAGRPQLVVPLAHDQFDNAARIFRNGSGLTLPKSKFRWKSAAERIQKLLQNAAFQRKATEYADIVRSEPGSQGAAQTIDQFLKQSNAEAETLLIQEAQGV